MDEYDYSYKIILLGGLVGKTAILNRYIKNKFICERSTLGVDIETKIINMDNGERIKLLILDTCGQELYWSMTWSHLKVAKGILLIYDVTNKSSLEDLNRLLDKIKEIVPKDIPKFVVGNKIDDKNNRKVTREEGEEFAKENGLLYYECSAKTGENINEIFGKLVQIIHDKYGEENKKEAKLKAEKRRREEEKIRKEVEKRRKEFEEKRKRKEFEEKKLGILNKYINF